MAYNQRSCFSCLQKAPDWKLYAPRRLRRTAGASWVQGFTWGFDVNDLIQRNQLQEIAVLVNLGRMRPLDEPTLVGDPKKFMKATGWDGLLVLRGKTRSD